VLDTVLDEIVTTLKGAGVVAFRIFPEAAEALPASGGVSVGVESYSVSGSGLGDYLGTRRASGGAAEKELYGKKIALTLGLEVFVPFGHSGGAAACDRAADKLRDALAAMPAAIKILEMDCGEVSADEVLGAYRCRCAAKCTAFLVAETDGEEPKFTDFKLKGTVKYGDQ
jgi:hypothetical protein